MRIERLLTAPSFEISSDADQASFSQSGLPQKHETPTPFTTRRCVTQQGRLDVTTPSEWSLEATSVFAECLAPSTPSKKTAIEENTLPSWLWSKKPEATAAKTQPETHANQVFDRITGSACYKGWKQGLWEDEVSASSFRDEAHHLLSQRMIALEIQDMRKLGLDWAYGLSDPSSPSSITTLASLSETPLGNATIDEVLCRPDSQESNFFQKLLQDSLNQSHLTVRFSDTEKEWNPLKNQAETLPTEQPRFAQTARGLVNLANFIDDLGDLDVFKLRHAVRVLTVLLDLHFDHMASTAAETRELEIGFENMAALLMRLGLAYDSRTGRATAAAIASIMTAEATATSAELAKILGKAPAYLAARDHSLRTLRNLRRAAYNEETDYERLSIVPQRLDIESGVHLVLIATARRRWDEAIEAAQKYGLRHMRTTGCFESPFITTFLDALSSGLAPFESCALDRATGTDEDDAIYTRVLHPMVIQALQSMRLDAADIRAASDHAIGYKTLKAANGFSQADLRDKGFDEETLNRIEEALSTARTMRTVFTPWTLGVDFCQNVLGLTASEIEDPFFDILNHLGFSQEQIREAEAFCFGHNTLSGLAEISEKAASVFAKGDQISPLARIKMAACVQSFMTHDIGLRLPLSANDLPATRSQLLLSSWQYGLRSVSLDFLSEKPMMSFVDQKAQQTTKPTQQQATLVSPQARIGLLAKKKAPSMPEPHAPALVQKAVSGITSAQQASPTKSAPSVKTIGLSHPNKNTPRLRSR